ncbi:hypothetical protein FVF58_42010 [Paraburkholderia panacisoli]|uniref:Uncharacterized protein n=1 Tax=Paraburkholderia panacisoli TaxID=2603818 RepID=A0A5B0G7H3_9BURK|nr:hypothetical protein [Paraburkholderia panacisoli]KAA0999344.1 hypothetical protein FVF58_42010 [Paraburkholderia panacisoli]
MSYNSISATLRKVNELIENNHEASRNEANRRKGEEAIDVRTAQGAAELPRADTARRNRGPGDNQSTK